MPLDRSPKKGVAGIYAAWHVFDVTRMLVTSLIGFVCSKKWNLLISDPHSSLLVAEN